jgi:DNA polymerase-3 subunit epsilon
MAGQPAGPENEKRTRTMLMDLDNIVVIDTETGGTDPSEHSLLSIALVRVGRYTTDGAPVSGEWFVREPVLSVTPKALEINQIDLRTIGARGYSPRGVCAALESFFVQQDMDPGKTILCGHNVAFDVGFLKRLYRLRDLNDYPFNYRTIDTHAIMWALGAAGKMPMCSSLDEGLAHFNIKVPEGERHTALGDAVATSKLLLSLLTLMQATDLPPRMCACGGFIWDGRFSRPSDGSGFRQLCCAKCAVPAPSAGATGPTEQPYKLPDKITRHRRNEMSAFIQALRQLGLDPRGIAVTAQVTNTRLCVPPLPAAEIHQLVESCLTLALGAGVTIPTEPPYKLPNKITENRTDAMHRLHNALRQIGLGTPAVLAAVQAANEHQCVPPLPDAVINIVVTGRTDQPSAPGGAK